MFNNIFIAVAHLYLKIMLTVLVRWFLAHFISLPVLCSYRVIIIQWLLKPGTTWSIKSQGRKNRRRQFYFPSQGRAPLQQSTPQKWPFRSRTCRARNSRKSILGLLRAEGSNFRDRWADLRLTSSHSSWSAILGHLRISCDACTSTLEKSTSRKKTARSSTPANSPKRTSSAKRTLSSILKRNMKIK